MTTDIVSSRLTHLVRLAYSPEPWPVVTWYRNTTIRRRPTLDSLPQDYAARPGQSITHHTCVISNPRPVALLLHDLEL